MIGWAPWEIPATGIITNNKTRLTIPNAATPASPPNSAMRRLSTTITALAPICMTKGAIPILTMSRTMSKRGTIRLRRRRKTARGEMR